MKNSIVTDKIINQFENQLWKWTKPKCIMSCLLVFKKQTNNHPKAFCTSIDPDLFQFVHLILNCLKHADNNNNKKNWFETWRVVFILGKKKESGRSHFHILKAVVSD